MGKKPRGFRQRNPKKLAPQKKTTPTPGIKHNTKIVDSLFDNIQEGNEYGSIVDLMLKENVSLLNEILKGLTLITTIRNKPCLMYAGNVVRSNLPNVGIEQADDLPFAEMLRQIPSDVKDIDLILSTVGGLGQQVGAFVEKLRSRFDNIDFIIPSRAMSAGTLFALSGDNIYMTEDACLGPIDPQVLNKDGKFVPAQALLLLVEECQKKGEEALQDQGSIPWSIIRIIDTIDKKDLANAITSTEYSTNMATEYLKNYKFKNWKKTETNGTTVTEIMRKDRAEEIAAQLASHEKWKNHGHAISRDVLYEELKLKIEHPNGEFEKAILKFWALLHWVFEKTPMLKLIMSNYSSYCTYQTK